MKERDRPIKVLHVVGGMDAGGVETWLMHVLRRIDRQSYKFDFLTHTTKPCFYDQEIRSLGSSIIPCLHPLRPWLYASNFTRILNTAGPYDIVHSHVHHFSGFTLMLARYAGIQTRIAHSHNDTAPADERGGKVRKCYLWCAEKVIKNCATIRLACSRKAASSLFGCESPNHSQCELLYYGIDLEPFRLPVNGEDVRTELEIPEGAIVVGHVGRFYEQKNHTFLIDAFAELYRRERRAFLLLVGDGPLRGEIEEKVAKLNLSHRVRFAGVRADVPRVMRGGMDCFVLPSHHEGLPLVLLEAQAAGLPCIVSEPVTDEARVIPALMCKLPLSRPESWADQILSTPGGRIETQDAVRKLEATCFALPQSVAALTQCYSESQGEKLMHAKEPQAAGER